MKKYFLPVSVIFIILSACEPALETPEQEIVFKIGQDLKYNYSDIQLYDSSTHIFYFKEGHAEFDRISQSPFNLFADGTEVYSGSFWPAFLNSMPSGPFISSPSHLFTKRSLVGISANEVMVSWHSTIQLMR